MGIAFGLKSVTVGSTECKTSEIQQYGKKVFRIKHRATPGKVAQFFQASGGKMNEEIN